MQIGMGKLILAGTGAAIGMKVTKDPIVVAGCFLIGLGLGHVIDQRCPLCGAFLQFGEFLA